MESKKNFIAGFLSAILVCSCVTGALAASGAVSFSQVTLAMNGNAVFSEGDTVKAGNGQPIPSSITYTDRAGGGTTYLPLSCISKLLDTPVSWDSKTGTVSLGTVRGVSRGGGVAGAATDGSELPLNRVGRKVGNLTEVSPIAAPGLDILSRTEYRSQSDYTRTVSVSKEYVSVTVTNRGEGILVLQLGREYTVGHELLSSQVPVGQTVTRTFKVDRSSEKSSKLDIRATYYGGIGNMDFVITATQFDQ